MARPPGRPAGALGSLGESVLRGEPGRPCGGSTAARWLVGVAGAAAFAQWPLHQLLEDPHKVPEGAHRVFRQTRWERGEYNSSGGGFFSALPRAMVLRKWAKIYVKTQPRRGITVLLVEKLKPGETADASWTIVDNARRVTAINTRNKAVYAARKMNGVVYDDFRPLSKDEENQTW